MRQMLILAASLILSAAWMQAQTGTSSSSTGSTSGQSSSSQMGSGSSSSSSSGSETTVQGCLQGSAGSYTLTDKSGTTYQLSGDTTKLSDHVGHEVQVKGIAASDTSASSSPSGSSSSGTGSASASSTGASSTGSGSSSSQSNLTVKSVKMVSQTCTSSK